MTFFCHNDKNKECNKHLFRFDNFSDKKFNI